MGGSNQDILPEIDDNKHDLYLTLCEPGNDKVYETSLHISCNAARGESTAAGAFEEIWQEFEDLDIENKEGTPLIYYNDSSAALNMDQLLSSHDGACQAWADLFEDVNALHGIDISVVIIVPKEGFGDSFLVGEVEFTEPPNTYYNPFPYPFWQFMEGTPTPGQNNSVPSLTLFLRHALVKYNEDYYDPSYGIGPFSNPHLWEEEALGAYLISDPNDSPQRARKNDPNETEVKEG